jgi:hypothetical protein
MLASKVSTYAEILQFAIYAEACSNRFDVLIADFNFCLCSKSSYIELFQNMREAPKIIAC